MKTKLASKALDALIVVLMAITACAFAAWTSQRTEWPFATVGNASASMPRGLWRLDPLGESAIPNRGTVVAIKAPEKALELGCVRPGQVLLKYVVGVPGDVICVRPGGVHHGRGPGARIAPIRSGGEGLTPRTRCDVVGEGRVWVATGHARSCDSRYLGALDAGDILGRARPLVTWGDPMAPDLPRDANAPRGGEPGGAPWRP